MIDLSPLGPQFLPQAPPLEVIREESVSLVDGPPRGFPLRSFRSSSGSSNNLVGSPSTHACPLIGPLLGTCFLVVVSTRRCTRAPAWILSWPAWILSWPQCRSALVMVLAARPSLPLPLLCGQSDQPWRQWLHFFFFALSSPDVVFLALFRALGRQDPSLLCSLPEKAQIRESSSLLPSDMPRATHSISSQSSWRSFHLSPTKCNAHCESFVDTFVILRKDSSVSHLSRGSFSH